MHVTKILCATDFSSDAARAVQLATRLARESGAELLFAHVCHAPATLRRLDAPFPPDITEEMVEVAQRALDALVLDARAAGAPLAGAELATGVPWAELAAMLATRDSSLCVIATHGRTGMRRFLLGSVAEKIVRHAPCSVLVVPREAKLEAFTHALVLTDFTPRAGHALDLATELVPRHGTIELMHVVELERDAPRAAAALEDQAARERGKTSARILTRVAIGNPAARALEAIEIAPGIDLVVVGSDGGSRVKHALLGSVAERMVRHAHRAVLVAR